MLEVAGRGGETRVLAPVASRCPEIQAHDGRKLGGTVANGHGQQRKKGRIYPRKPPPKKVPPQTDGSSQLPIDSIGTALPFFAINIELMTDRPMGDATSTTYFKI